VTWRGPRKSAKDPLLARASHYRRNRQHWLALARTLGLRCSLCGCVIEWRKEYQRLPGGRENANYLVIGHVTSRYHAKRMGWTEQQINALSNSRPECKRCSNRSGAQLGQQVQRANAKIKLRIGRSDSDRW
jgi:hypothetical protein